MVPNKRLKRLFLPRYCLQFSSRVLSKSEIKVLGKGLDFAPFQRKVNEPVLRKHVEDFRRRMIIKLYFRNDISKNVSEVPAFSKKCSWNPPQGHPYLEVHLSQVDNKIF